MFDGMPEHFLAPTTSLSPSFSLHHANFQQQQQQQQCFDAMMPTCLVQQVGSEPSSLMVPHCVVVDNAPWSNEEVLSLLKIISSLDSPWFPSPFTWDNVSRKLAEVGFKRSAQKCKEKFEEETRSFNNNRHKSNVISQNYRLFGELEDLYNNNNNSNNNNNNNDNDDANNVNDGNNYANDHLDDDSREQQSRHLDNTFDFYPSDQMMNNNDDNKNDNSDVGDEEGGKGVVGGGEEREEEAKRIMRKRKREKKFEMFKGFCENIVNKVIAKQEEMHCKVLEDMLKREEEKIAREQAWKKQEIDRITQVMQVRAHEQAIVGDRQAKILGFLKKFSSLSSNNNGETNQSLGETLGSVVLKVQNTSTNSLLSTSSSMLSQDTISEPTTTTHNDQVSNLASQNSLNGLENNPQLALPISSSSLNQPFKNQVEPVSFDHTSTDATGQTVSFESSRNHNESKVVVADVKDDTGRRWPRDEVLALINIRCNLFDNNNGDHRDRESFSKGPLWERISQKMMELGYKRSAKRCKEKWENINKYFRKTKDSSKKRSIDSRTCPYFHQLSHLYNQQGALHDQFECPTNPAGLSGNKLVPSDGATAINTVPSQQNKGIVEQLPTCQMSSTLNFDYTIT